MDAEEEERHEVNHIELNEEPNDSSSNYRNNENTSSRIEERIRHLRMRARQRQERRLSVEVVNVEPLRLNEAESPSLPLHSTPEGRLRSDRSKRGENHSFASDGGVGEAAQVKKNSGEAFFDCNICLGKAKDPIVTWCGHLYCWPCFYLLPNVRPETKECPECKEDVNDSGIIPIYGNSDKALKIGAEKSGVTIPPRPRANRVESLRQRIRTRVEETVRNLHSDSTQSNNLSSALSSAEILAEQLGDLALLYQEFGNSFYDDLVDVPSGAVVPNSNSDTETDSPPSPRRISHRRSIHSRENFSDLTVPRSRRISTPFQQIQLPEQRRRSLRMQERSGVSEWDENPPDAPLLVDAIPESNDTVPPSSIRRHENVLDISSDASGSGTRERR